MFVVFLHLSFLVILPEMALTQMAIFNSPVSHLPFFACFTCFPSFKCVHVFSVEHERDTTVATERSSSSSPRLMRTSRTKWLGPNDNKKL